MCLCSSLRFEKKQKNLQQKRRKLSPRKSKPHTHTYIPSHGSKQKNSEIAAKNTSV